MSVDDDYWLRAGFSLPRVRLDNSGADGGCSSRVQVDLALVLCEQVHQLKKYEKNQSVNGYALMVVYRFEPC